MCVCECVRMCVFVRYREGAHTSVWLGMLAVVFDCLFCVQMPACELGNVKVVARHSTNLTILDGV